MATTPSNPLANPTPSPRRPAPDSSSTGGGALLPGGGSSAGPRIESLVDLGPDICHEIASLAAPCADALARVSTDFRSATKQLRRWRTCSDCREPFRECDQTDGLGIFGGKTCFSHTGSVKTWEWEGEPMPGVEW